jgi:hypothetical protein
VLRKLRARLTYANVVATLALIVAVGGTSAYAANTIRSSDIVDGEILSADVKDQSLTTFDVSTFLGADVVDGTLTSADVAPGTFVQGRGQLLTSRIVRQVGDLNQPLLTIPGLGRLIAGCYATAALISWENNTGGPVDVWIDSPNAQGHYEGVVRPNGQTATVSEVSQPDRSTPSHSTVLSLGTGADPTAREVATIQVSALQEKNNNPCGFQAQGTLWTSP